MNNAPKADPQLMQVIANASSTPTKGVDVLGPVLKWAGAFAVYGLVMVSIGDSDKYGDVATALAWVVMVGAFFYWYNDFDTSLAGMLGQGKSLAK